MTSIALTPETSSASFSKWWLSGVVVWVALFALALWFDASAAKWAHDSGVAAAIRAHRISELWKGPGNYVFTLLVVGVGLALQKLNGREALFVCVAGALSGLNVVVKWMVGRTRPYKLGVANEPLPFRLQPFWHGIGGLFHQKALSFPSGHESVAFSLAVAIALIRPRQSWIFFILALAVGVERVLENAHYLSDVLAAVPLATAGAFIAWVIVQPAATTVQTG